MCKIRKNALLGLVATCLSFLACSEEIDTSARYVFTENTVVSYLEKHSDDYSEYVELLKKVPVSRRSQSTLYQLMSARGNYTCFAPTNDAIHEYLQQLVDTGLIAEPSWAAFPDSAKLDSIRQVIVKNSIIDGADLESQRFLISYFPDGQLARRRTRRVLYQRRLPYRFAQPRHRTAKWCRASDS